MWMHETGDYAIWSQHSTTVPLTVNTCAAVSLLSNSRTVLSLSTLVVSMWLLFRYEGLEIEKAEKEESSAQA